MALVLALFTLQLARQSCLANFEYYADPRNPYVYAHTSGAITQLENQLEDIAIVAPEKYDTTVVVISPTGDYWPLPWYLRKFKNVGFFDRLPEEDKSPIYSAPILIVSYEIAAELSKKFDGKYFMARHALRPRVLLYVFIRNDIWDAFIATRNDARAP